MSYDFFGGAFSNSAKLNAPIIDCHSRACGKPFDIDSGLSEYLDAGVPADKLVLGLGTYGRTFKLATPVGSGPTPPPGFVMSTGGEPHLGSTPQCCPGLFSLLYFT